MIKFIIINVKKQWKKLNEENSGNTYHKWILSILQVGTCSPPDPPSPLLSSLLNIDHLYDSQSLKIFLLICSDLKIFILFLFSFSYLFLFWYVLFCFVLSCLVLFHSFYIVFWYPSSFSSFYQILFKKNCKCLQKHAFRVSMKTRDSPQHIKY